MAQCLAFLLVAKWSQILYKIIRLSRDIKQNTRMEDLALQFQFWLLICDNVGHHKWLERSISLFKDNSISNPWFLLQKQSCLLCMVQLYNSHNKRLAAVRELLMAFPGGFLALRCSHSSDILIRSNWQYKQGEFINSYKLDSNYHFKCLVHTICSFR